MKISHAVWLGGVSALALASSAYAQSPAEGQVDEVVVTGSRVIANGNQAPTPVTVLSSDKLLETAPTNLADALNRLPQFASAPSSRNIGNAGSNTVANYLNLRRFGPQRNLILIDGSRVPPTGSNGAVDTNIIPQALVERVEVVTGGASAVYGSDAVTGVINFVMDRDFTGLKFNSQVGISTYGDNENWRIGGAAGTPLFGGRGHVEFAFDHYDSKGVFGPESRPEGVSHATLAGAGTAANPFKIIYDGRIATSAIGGLITAPTNVPALRDVAFHTNGVAGAFIHGAATGTVNLEAGGQGNTYNYTSIVSNLRTNQAFARFDYDVTDSVHASLQASYNDAWSKYPYLSTSLFQSSIASGNPFIPPSIQAIMTANNVPFIHVSRSGERNDPYPAIENETFATNVFVKAGLEGSFADRWDWTANYIYSRSTTSTSNVGNKRNDKIAAATDAVVDPRTGRIVCAVSLTAFASRYEGCEPVNIFGPTAPTVSSVDWLSDTTKFTLANLMHNANFSVSGSPFDIWAGPVTMAVSGEYRWMSLRNNGNVETTGVVDCTGLRIIGQNCAPTMLKWYSDTTAPMYAEQNVKELAGELLIPLIKDVPLVRSFEVNLAGRYTDYSTSGGVRTWKVGGTWELTDDFKLRGTMSRDIRAPTLNDLFAPSQGRPGGYTDVHTGRAGTTNNFSKGNPDLTPEVARTNTVGLVYQPSWAPRLSVAVDYFEISINNAITTVAASNVIIQRECEDSNGTSPYCALYQRPLPFSNRSPENYPTALFSQGVNAARNWTRGWDIEANYRLQMADLFASVPGDLAVRGLATYQPLLKSQSTAAIPPTESAGIAGVSNSVAGSSKLVLNLNLAYTNGGFSLGVAQRWQSGVFFSDPRINVDTRGKIPAYTYTDISMSYRTDVGGHEITPFLTIENLFNKRPPIAGSSPNVPGLFFPSAPGYDAVGRYFTVGVRGRL